MFKEPENGTKDINIERTEQALEVKPAQVTILPLLFAFMPKGFNSKIAWIIFIIMLGVFVAISRIGVGAHFPLDVAAGVAIGYIAAIFAIVTTNKIKCGAWTDHKKYHIVIMVLLLLWGCAIVNEILAANLFVFYCALISIITTLYLMIISHVKK
jgi:hypothetical protein